MPVTTLRLSKDELRRIDRIARRQGVDRAALLRRAISGGVREVALSDGVARYQRGECSPWRAASDAGVGLWEFLEELQRRGVPFRTDEGHLEGLIDAKKIVRSRRFVDKWRGALIGHGDPVKLKHAAFRDRRH